MKIGITETSYSRWGDMRYRKMKEAGFDCADFEMADTDTVIYQGTEAEMLAYLQKEKALADEAGITFSQCHGPWRWPPRDGTPEDRAERMEKMKKSICAAEILGIRNWVVHPIMPYGTEDMNHGDAQKTWDMNLVFMRELLCEAKRHDVVICFENMPMPAFSIGSPEQILRFVREMNDDHFKVCLDTGHVNVFSGKTLGDAVRLLGGEIRVLHIHDNDGRADLHRLPYFGTADWNGFIRALSEVGYTGVLSFETGASGEMPLAVYDAINALLAVTGRTWIHEITEK